jgi:Lantibiotic dehydratase, C terminus./Lantibiotic dehydratase, N terminus.
MSTRPTPFGMLAGVAVGKWGDSTQILLSAQPRATMTKVSFPWIESLVRSLESKEEILTSLELMTNPAIFVRGNRAIIPERMSPAKLEERSRVSLRMTGALKLTLESAWAGIQYPSLKRLLTKIEKRRGGTALSFIRFLVEQKFLLTNLNPPISNKDQLAYVIDKLHKAGLTQKS